MQTKPDDALTNIITGHVAPDRVNVDDALIIGDRMAAEFTAGLPQGFHIPLKKNVITMEVAKKGLKIQDAFEYKNGKTMHAFLFCHRPEISPCKNFFSGMNCLLCQCHCLMTTGSCVREIKVSWLTSWQFLLQMTLNMLRWNS